VARAGANVVGSAPYGPALGLGRSATASGGAVQRKAAANPELEAFKAKKHEKKPFNSPTTKGGLFDISYDPKTARMEALFRISFKFLDGSAADYPKAKPGELKWTEAEKKSWQSKFITLVEGRWGGKFLFQCTKPGFESIDAYVDVEVESAAKDWHFEASVTRIPKGEFRGSSVTTHKGKTDLNKNKVTLDSEDMTWTDKGGTEKQMGAVHEFGHMIGLGDEYADGKPGITHGSLVKDALGKDIAEGDTDDVMSTGNKIRQQHYVTFLEGLKAATNMPEWKFK
jgi:hypothetical protein